ncbi:MAG: D-alanyl-D-alanine carboxypeptidase/D-alanyl-D-alanine-endopeptidase [Phycisphaerales bacterium]|nr:D-alanyl-D-alanine carboxypeptidase/D-alanyl-D-alanine-endopeptidase [Phycisphaerales bacterium]
MLKSRLHTNILLSLLACTSIGTSSRADLQKDVQAAVRNAGLGKTVVAVSVRDTSDSSEVVEILDKRGMIPASNMKLFTSGAALHRFGPDFLTQTELLIDGKRLWFVGSGDPALGDPVLLEKTSWSMPTADGGSRIHDGLEVDLFIDLMIKSILDAGVDSLDEVIIDDRIFDREYFHPDWPVDQLDKKYCAEVAGTNMHLNLLTIHAHPGNGSRAKVQRTEPRMPWLDMNMAATNRQGKKDTTTIGVSRLPGRNNLRVYGNVGEPILVQVTLSNMPEILARLMEHRLREAGIEVGTVRLATENDPAASGKKITPTFNTPIATLITRCNTDSQNLYAESLCKMLGHDVEDDPGSWTNGTRAVRMVVRERLGPEHAKAFQAADGSGLSRKNRITAEMTTAWLSSLSRDPELGPIYLESLAKVGSTGTVRSRGAGLPNGVRVDCKTGYINGVSCLSGVVTGPDDRQYAFSVLCNDIPGNVPIRSAKKLQDQVVRLLAEDLVKQKTATGAN